MGTLLPVVALLLFLVPLEMTSSSSSPWYALGAESSSSSLNLMHFFLRLERDRRGEKKNFKTLLPGDTSYIHS